MDDMFYNASGFENHDLSNWNVKNVSETGDFFYHVGSNNIEPKWVWVK